MRFFSSNSQIHFRYLLIFLLVISCATDIFASTDLTRQSALQSETEAVSLSKDWSGDSIHRSILLFSEAAEGWKTIGEEKKSAFCLRESAKLSLLISDYEKAFEALNNALKMDDKIRDKEGKVLTLSILSRAANQKGDVKKSESYYKQALALSKSTSSDYAQANALFSAADYNSSFGNIKETIKLYEQALSFAEKTEDKNLTAQILLNIGYSYAREENPVYGLQKVKEGLAILEEIGDKRGQALANFGVGFLYTLMDEKQNALDFYRKAEVMFPDDIDWLEKAKLFNGIATIYERYGELNLGETYRRKALELFEKAKFPYGQLATLIGLAKLSYLKDDRVSGEKLYDEALVLAKKLNDNFHLAIIKENFGNSYLADGDYDKAITNFLEALSVYKSLNVVLPRVENSLGKAYEKKGDYKLARKFYNSALQTNRKIKDIIPAAENLYNLALLSKAEGDLEASFKQAKESLEITESVYYDVANSNLRRSYLSNVFDRYDLYINLLLKMHRQNPNSNYLIEALQAAEKSRARSMLETLTLSEANFTKDANPETLLREKEIRILLNAKADKLTDLLTQKADQTEIEKVSNEIKELEHNLEEIKAVLKRNSPVYSAVKNPEPFDAAEFQNKVLDENSLLLEFSFGNEESYLWVVGKNEINLYFLPSREQIENRIEKLAELLTSRKMRENESIEEYRARINEAEKSYWQEAQILSGEFFGQFADKLSDKRLIIVPDGKLHFFPVSALPFPNSITNEPILLTNEIVFEPSASMLLLLAESNSKSPENLKNLLVFTDPVFKTDDSRLPAEFNSDKTSNNENPTAHSLDNLRFVESLNSLPRLTASKEEGDAVVQIVGASNSDIFSGFSANRQQFLNANLSDYKIIHLATHGLVNEERPELSGIILSRFDENGQKLDEFVRLQDIYALNLNADLVVLSACDTGIGKEIKGEGLMSLTNGFMQVGAKSVVSSLWKVDDYATLELMKNFYGFLAEGNTTTSQALRKAQIKMWQNPRYKSPFYWAAFTVQGDFKRAPQISGGFNYSYLLLLLPLIALTAAGFWIYKFRSRLERPQK